MKKKLEIIEEEGAELKNRGISHFLNDNNNVEFVKSTVANPRWSQDEK
jgi:hypothetical protein